MSGLLLPDRAGFIYPDPAVEAEIVSAISTHEAAVDPHPGYVLEADAVREMAKASRAAQTITTSTSTQISFDTEDFDTDGMFTPTSTVITVPRAGIYKISAYASWAANAVGRRHTDLRLNGSSYLRRHFYDPQTDGPVNTMFSFSDSFQLAASDTIGLEVFQTSGGNLNVNATLTVCYQRGV